MEKTIKNLAAAFIGESQARNRYTMYAKTAKKEGYESISAAFLATADNEREHAKWLFILINQLNKKSGGDFSEILVHAGCPTALGTTVDNLKAAIAGENHEYTTMYPEFADTAEKEGLGDIADRLRAIANAEEHHEGRYKKYLADIVGGTVFKNDSPAPWVCLKCGYVHNGEEAPDECPSCNHPKAYFELLCE